MRIHLKIEPASGIIPFEHQRLLTGTIHKWLGKNEEHGKPSLYSFSRLSNGKKENNGLSLKNGSTFFISAYDDGVIKKIIKGIQQDPTMFFGLTVSEIIIQENPDLNLRSIFYTASPIFIKWRTENKTEHIIYTDKRADEILTNSLKYKLNKAGIVDDTLAIHFQQNDVKAGTKKITYNGIDNKANWCSVKITGKPETKLFAWNVGLGSSTGIGFGAIK